MLKLGLEKAKEFQENICFIDYVKASDCVDNNKLWKILKEMGILTLTGSCEIKKHQLKPDMEQQIVSKLGKEYITGVYCHLAYLTYMQNTSCKMLGWMKHKLESITSDMQMMPPLW